MTDEPKQSRTRYDRLREMEIEMQGKWKQNP